MDIAKNLEILKTDLPDSVKLVAVTKTHPEDLIMQLYHAGHKIMGENKVQELAGKYHNLPKDIQWHMIGHLQSNKVKYIAPFVSLIHSVDSAGLLETINKEAIKNNRVIDCLLQLRIAREETKYGLQYEDITAILQSQLFHKLNNIKILGLMGMATFTDDTDIVREEFNYLAMCFWKLKGQYFTEKPYFCELSMGMSDDYKLAVEAGSTIVRIGSLIFGERNYK
ncbi:MAG: YggS family pyridoxal phosphate-dependent enzyme [Bacteroidales bacterium]|nr:YggS family pyridoxal phosphate-dependent enzyme [Bacteroidales bacterium]